MTPSAFAAPAMAANVIQPSRFESQTPKVHSWLLRHRRFHFNFTPTYGSWMNLVERWFSALTTKKLKRSAHRNGWQLAVEMFMCG